MTKIYTEHPKLLKTDNFLQLEETAKCYSVKAAAIMTHKYIIWDCLLYIWHCNKVSKQFLNYSWNWICWFMFVFDSHFHLVSLVICLCPCTQTRVFPALTNKKNQDLQVGKVVETFTQWSAVVQIPPTYDLVIFLSLTPDMCVFSYFCCHSVFG